MAVFTAAIHRASDFTTSDVDVCVARIGQVLVLHTCPALGRTIHHAVAVAVGSDDTAFDVDNGVTVVRNI